MDALPTNALGARLCSIFPYRWKTIESSNHDSTAGVSWKTNVKHPLKPRSLWVRYQDASQLIGVRFGSATEYFMLDIDAMSVYLGQVDHILAALETIGIVRVVIVQSSHSGGIHIYAPLPRQYPTFSVACAVTAALEAQGILLQPGQCEVFPNMKAYAKPGSGEFIDYAAHRLPLQPATGSYLLDNNLQPIPGGESLSRFFAHWDNAIALQDGELLDEAIALARSNRRRRRRAVGPVASWRTDLELVINEGWSGPHQTNDLLKQIATYGRVFLALEGAELAEYVERTAEASPGYERWCRHQHEIWKRACMWGRAVENYYWPLGSTPLRSRPSLASICDERANDARERIRAAMEQLGGFVGNVKELAKELAKTARTSFQTLYRNVDLWHPSPPPPPEQAARPVTAPTASAPGPLGSILSQINASLEQADLAWVTGLTPVDETWGLQNCPKKSFNSGLDEGSARGEGFSTGGLDDRPL